MCGVEKTLKTQAGLSDFMIILCSYIPNVVRPWALGMHAMHINYLRILINTGSHFEKAQEYSLAPAF